MDRFEAMKAFVRVVESGSFTKAAETLQMSRTSMTHLIQQLEAKLGVTLLNRTTRRVNVTVDGAAYFERVVRLLADLEEAETSLPNAEATPRGRLRIDVPSPLATLILVPAMPAFHAQYPDIQLDMGVSDRMADVIGDNVDCVIRGGPIADQSLRARHLCDLQLGVYAAPSYVARLGMPSSPEDLEKSRHRIVGFGLPRNGKALSYDLRRGSERVTVQGQYVVAIDDGNAYLAAGLAGMGILCLPDYMARPHVDHTHLVKVLDGWGIEPMPIYAAFPPNRHVSKKLRVFIDWVAELMSQNMNSAGALRPKTSIAAGSPPPT